MVFRRSYSYGSRSTRGGGGGQSTSRSAARTANGTFEGGTWKCECNPPLPAVRIQVKKKGKNRGKWFWSCPRPREAQCDFFAWDDGDPGTSSSSQSAIVTTIGQGAPPLPDLTPTPIPAARRISSASVSSPFNQIPVSPANNNAYSPSLNSNSNSATANRIPNTPTRIPRNSIIQNRSVGRSGSGGGGLFVDDDLDDVNNFIDLQTGNEEQPSTPPSLKRRRIKMENGDDEYVAIHHVPSPPSITSRAPQPQTPQNQRSISQYFGRAHAGSKETQEDLLGELDSDDERRLAEMSDSSQTTTQKISQLEREECAALPDKSPALATPSTPTPRRSSILGGGLLTPVTGNGPTTTSRGKTGKRAGTGEVPGSASSQLPATQLTADGDYELTAQVMGLLAGQPISESVRAAVRDTLNSYALRARGVERGREMTRVALQARNATISELQAQIASLKEEKRLRQARVRQLLGPLLGDEGDQ